MYEWKATPMIPKKIQVANLPDEPTPVGALIIETADETYSFAVNRDVAAILRKALAVLERHVGVDE